MYNSTLQEFKGEIRLFTILGGIVILLFFIAAAFFGSPSPRLVQAASTTSIQSGSWSDPAIWNTGNVPSTGDTVNIASGHTVTYDVLSDNVVGDVDIQGTLYFSRTTNTRLKTNGNIIVKSGGFLDMGTAQDFIPSNIKAEVIFALSQAQVNAYKGGFNFEATDKGLWTMSGGRWDVHGVPLLRTWSKLAANANAGASTVVVEHNVTDWYVGGTVAFSSTVQPSSYYIRSKDGRWFRRNSWQEELRVITAIQPVSGGRTQLTLDRPLSFAHSGTGTMRGEVGLLTRNVLITTQLEGYNIADDAPRPDTSQRKFAHTLYMHGAEGHTNYAEFKYMGSPDRLSRYPMHVHLAQSTSRGKIFRGNAIWMSGHNGIVTHNSNGVLVEDNVMYDIRGIGMWIEVDPKNQSNPQIGPQENKFVHNLGIRFSFSSLLLDHLDQFVAGNVASGIGSGGKTGGNGTTDNLDSSGGAGFEWSSRSNNSGKIIPFIFIKNESHSNKGSGVRSWNNAVPAFDILDLHSWRNGRHGMFWGAYAAPYRYFNALFEENALHGASALSIKGYFQDSVMRGDGGASNAPLSRGFFINGYIASPFPDTPIHLIRSTFENFTSAAIEQEHGTCGHKVIANEDTYMSVSNGQCIPNYMVIQGSAFNVQNSFQFGWQRNINSFWKVFDYNGPGNFPKDFVLLRADQSDPANQTAFTRQLVTPQSYYSPEADALVTPLSSLGGDVSFTGLKWYSEERNRINTIDHTFKVTPDYPPQVSLAISTTGKQVTMNATVTDDKGVSKVQFWLDDKMLIEKTAPPYTHTVDLSQHPRRYAYLYVRGVDAFDNEAYSKVTELGPEFILGGSAPPPPAPPPPPTPPTPPPPPANTDPTANRTNPSSASVSVPQNNSQTFALQAQDIDANLSQVVWTVEGIVTDTSSIQGSSDQASFTHTFTDPVGTVVGVQAETIDNLGGAIILSWNVTITQPSTPPPTPPPPAPTPTSTPTPTPTPTPPPPTPRVGDLDGDGKVNIADISILLSRFGKTDADSLQKADISSGLNNSSAGKIDIFDANKLMANWTG